MTVVFDTNILFSATGWRGNPYECIKRARQRKIQAATCPELMMELSEKLQLRLRFSPEQSAETVADYLSFMRLVQIPNKLRIVARDPDDDAVIECAVVGGAEYVITCDHDLLELKKYDKIKMITPAELMLEFARLGY